ncbi:MAG: hypothetical protein KDD45_09180 [Bdellovibrionales bacterium]|nr:hypothetical protein [Bdellovibrionales bacterium]
MKKLIILTGLIISVVLAFTACGQKDEGNKDYEVTQARQAYDRCSALKGQSYCNMAKIGNVVSMSEFYGQSYYNNSYYGYNYLSGAPMTNQLSVDQVNSYFENYVKKASKQEILSMSNMWLQMSSNNMNPLAYPTSRCTSYGCF